MSQKKRPSTLVWLLIGLAILLICCVSVVNTAILGGFTTQDTSLDDIPVVVSTDTSGFPEDTAEPTYPVSTTPPSQDEPAPTQSGSDDGWNLLYFIDFSADIHEVGSPPALAPRDDAPSRIPYGEPLVASSFLDLTTKCLVFNTDPSHYADWYDQVQLDMEFGYEAYAVMFHVVTQGLVGSDYEFKVLVDIPRVNNVVFSGKDASLYLSQDPATSISFPDEVKKYVVVEVDFQTRLMTLYFDDTMVSEVPLTDGEDIRAIRFSLGPRLMDGDLMTDDVSVAIDNIEVWGK